jgi:predicted ATP-grasp superfamily ATP-dependent carboligase
MRKCIIVINPTGAVFPKLVNNNDIKKISIIYKTLDLQDLFPEAFINQVFNLNEYDEQIIFSNFNDLTNRLNDYHIVNIIAETDVSLELADLLRIHFNLKSNIAELINTRKNKFEYLSLLYNKGLVTKKPWLLTSEQDIKNIDTTNSKYILKPVLSAGSKNTFFLDERPSNQNIFPCIMQEYIKGQEYSVDIVSYDNTKHKLISVFKYVRDPYTIIKKEIWLLDPVKDKHIISKLYDFACESLNQLGYCIGASHTEIIIEETGKMSIVECNFRKQGHLDYYSTTAAFKLNQSTALITNPEKLSDWNTYSINSIHVRFLVNIYNSKNIDDIIWDEVENIPIVHNIIKHDFVRESKPTTCIADCLGYITALINQPSDLIYVKKIRNWLMKL